MSRIIVIGVIAGLFTGVIALTLTCVVSLALTFIGGATVVIPGLFSSWPGSAPDGTPQLRFNPEFLGMGVSLAIWTVGIAAIAVGVSRNRAHRRAPIDG